MKLYKITVHENTYETYLVEADCEEEAQTYLENGDLNSSASYIADWDIVSIAPYVERES
tara:strand:- start:5 stop:181 length:177 start_codon:yes stop_codon:yes gene_type:complete